MNFSQLHEILQGGPAISVEIPLENFLDCLHAVRTEVGRVELQARANRVFACQILLAKTVSELPKNALQEELVRGQWLAAMIFSNVIQVGMQGDEGFYH